MVGSSTIPIRKENDSENLTGECTQDHASHFKEDMKRLGKDKFTFEIICNYKTRGGVVSGEVHFQTDNDVLSPELLPCGERLYYNGQIGSVKFITPEFLSAEARAKMVLLLKEKKSNCPWITLRRKLMLRSAKDKASLTLKISARTRAKMS